MCWNCCLCISTSSSLPRSKDAFYSFSHLTAITSLIVFCSPWLCIKWFCVFFYFFFFFTVNTIFSSWFLSHYSLSVGILQDSIINQSTYSHPLNSPWVISTFLWFYLTLHLTVIESKSEVTQLCLTLCNPMDCSLPASSLHGVLQARILEWVAISFSRGSSWLRDQTRASCIADICFNLWATSAQICPTNLRTIHPEAH